MFTVTVQGVSPDGQPVRFEFQAEVTISIPDETWQPGTPLTTQVSIAGQVPADDLNPKSNK